MPYSHRDVCKFKEIDVFYFVLIEIRDAETLMQFLEKEEESRLDDSEKASRGFQVSRETTLSANLVPSESGLSENPTLSAQLSRSARSALSKKSAKSDKSTTFEIAERPLTPSPPPSNPDIKRAQEKSLLKLPREYVIKRIKFQKGEILPRIESEAEIKISEYVCTNAVLSFLLQVFCLTFF